MDSLQVKACLDVLFRSKVNIKYDVIPSDDLNNIIKYEKSKFIVICNLQPSWMQGSHYIVVGHLLQHVYEVYDSLANSINTYDKDFFEELIKRNPIQNHVKHQSDTSSQCGGFCIRYVYFRLKGFSINKTLNTFYKNQQRNDQVVKCFLKCKFGKLLTKMKYFKLANVKKCVQHGVAPCCWQNQ
jgi:hypothetical protein